MTVHRAKQKHPRQNYVSDADVVFLPPTKDVVGKKRLIAS